MSHNVLANKRRHIDCAAPFVLKSLCNAMVDFVEKKKFFFVLSQLFFSFFFLDVNIALLGCSRPPRAKINVCGDLIDIVGGD